MDTINRKHLDLAPYANKFKVKFRKYSDEKYQEIVDLVEHRFCDKRILENISRFESVGAVSLLEPLTRIKNYKSQIPFPIDVGIALGAIARLKACTPSVTPLAGGPEGPFRTLIGMQGFQLPSVSAVFHFCHPSHYPIVDKNVVEACQFLKSHDNIDLELPLLPYATDPPDKQLATYRDLIHFINALIDHRANTEHERLSYRYIDTALMVLGAEKRKEKREAAKKLGKQK